MRPLAAHTSRRGVLLLAAALFALAIVVALVWLWETRRSLLYVFLDPAVYRVINHRIANSSLPVELAWQYRCPQPIDSQLVVGEDDTIYVGAGKVVYALSAGDGRVRWRWQVDNKGYGFVFPYGDLVLITADRDSVIQAVRADDGAFVWQVALKDYVEAPGPLFGVFRFLADNERIYVVVDLNRGIDLLALEPATGRLVWKAEPAYGPVANTAFLEPKEPTWITVYERDTLVSFDRATGEVRRRDHLALESASEPLYYDGLIYTCDNGTRAVDLATKTDRWTYFADEGCILNPPGIVAGFAFISAAEELVSVDAASGQVSWRNRNPAVYSNIRDLAVLGDLTYVLTSDAILRALDVYTGREIGRLQANPPGMPRGRPGYLRYLAAGKDNLFLTFGSHTLFAFRPAK